MAPIVKTPSPLAASVLPSFVATAELRGFRGAIDLPEADQAHLRTASRKRRDEFAAGRLCASAALKALGASTVHVGRQTGGAPIWPEGMIGSISHTDDVAVAAATPSRMARAIGLDIEQVGAVQPDTWGIIFSDIERQRLSEAGPKAQGRLATALFAAKEAFYKAQWPVTQEWLDFMDVEIDVDGTAFSVIPRARRAWTKCFGGRLTGRLAETKDVIIAAVLA